MPEGWEWKKIGDIATKVTSGGTPSRKNKSYYTGNIPWVKSGELNDNYITDTEEKITLEALKNSSAKVFPKDSVLIALYGATIGKAGILKIEAATNQACCAIIVDRKRIIPEYIFYFLRSKLNDFRSEGFGGAQNNISQGVIKKTEIPIPYPHDPDKSIEIQHRYVSLLDSFFQEYKILKKEKEKAKENYEKILSAITEKAIFNDNSNDYNEAPLFDLITKITSGSRNWKKYYSKTGNALFIRTQDVASGSLDISSIEKIDPKNDQERDRTRVFKDDVLMTITGWIGKTVIVPSEFPESYVNQSTALIRPNPDKINPEYLNYFFKTIFAQSQIRNIVVGIGRESLSLTNIKKLRIKYPNLEKQKRIVEKINYLKPLIKSTVNKQEEIIKSLNILPSAVLTKAFQGELIT